LNKVENVRRGGHFLGIEDNNYNNLSKYFVRRAEVFMNNSKQERIDAAIVMKDKEALAEFSDEEKKIFLGLMAGQAQAFNFNRTFNRVAFLVVMKKIRQSEIYKKLEPYHTWEKFCRLVGVSPSSVYEELQNLETFGAEYYQIMKRIGLGRSDLRAMRALPEGAMRFDGDGFVEIDGEKFKLELDNAEAIKEAIEGIQERAREKVKEAEAEAQEAREDLKAARQVMGEKEIENRKLKEKIEGPKFTGPEEMVKHVDMIYRNFGGALAQLESFPLDEAVDHYKVLTRLRSFLEHILCDLTNYVYEMDQHYTGLRPDPMIVNEYREEIMRLADHADEEREERRKLKKFSEYAKKGE